MQVGFLYQHLVFQMVRPWRRWISILYKLFSFIRITNTGI